MNDSSRVMGGCQKQNANNTVINGSGRKEKGSHYYTTVVAEGLLLGVQHLKSV